MDLGTIRANQARYIAHLLFVRPSAPNEPAIHPQMPHRLRLQLGCPQWLQSGVRASPHRHARLPPRGLVCEIAVVRRSTPQLKPIQIKRYRPRKLRPKNSRASPSAMEQEAGTRPSTMARMPVQPARRSFPNGSHQQEAQDGASDRAALGDVGSEQVSVG